MNISPLEEYALRCAVQLAKIEPDKHLSASRIAELEKISVEYVSKIMFLFRRAKVVKSVRGINGGFKLDRPPEKITLKELFDALPINKRVDEEFCSQYVGQSDECVHLDTCSIRPFWMVLSKFFNEFTSTVTIRDLLDSELKVRKRVKELWPAKKAKELKEAL